MSEEMVPVEQPAVAETVPEEAVEIKKTRSERREQAVCDAMRTLIRDMFLDMFGCEPGKDHAIPIALNMKLRPADNWALEFDPGLREQLEVCLGDAEAGFNVYEPGWVYNFYEDASRSEASWPPSSLSVFKGYDSRGVPQWHELVQAFLDSGDERAGELYGDRAPVLARLQYGKELSRDQLSSFGKASRTYAVLAQVVAGYFRLPSQKGSNREDRLALTFQVVEGRSADRTVRLNLNVLSHLPWKELEQLFSDGWEPGIRRACSQARRSLNELEERVIRLRRDGRLDDASSAMRAVPEILKRLAGSLERSHRQTGRRTRHSQQRKGQRPTHKALEDAAGASPDALYHDEKTQAWIACGEQGRAHVFSKEGKHITSFMLKPDSVRFRVKTRRWRAMTEAEVAAFRGVIAGGG